VGRPQQCFTLRTFVYPTQLGGNRVFNANGIPQNTQPITADFRGRNLQIGMPATLASAFANPNGWAMKTLESNDDYNRRTAITALRFDGHYEFTEGFHLHFGVRNSIRSASNDGYTLVTPVYAGMGASDPNGCLVRYVGSDVILSGNATDTTPSTWCTAGNSQGYFRAGPLSSQLVSKPRRRSPTTSRNTPTCWGRGSPSGRSIHAPWMTQWGTGNRSIRGHDTGRA